MTYEIVEDGKAIKCLHCGMTSHSAGDVRELYCGNCKEFHDEKEKCRFCDLVVSYPCECPPADYCEKALASCYPTRQS